jgi:hypothetical protein
MTELTGDPALGYLGEFLAAGLNAISFANWDSVCPSRDEERQPARHVFYHDPKESFEENRLPAIYLWRRKSKPVRVADDLYRETWDIHVAWIMEGASETHRRLRLTMMKELSTAIYRLVIADRIPQWRHPDDVTAFDVRRGSSVSNRCGFSRLQPSSIEAVELLFQRMEESAPEPYYGFELVLEADEYPEAAALYQRVPAKLNATESTNDGPDVAIRRDVA